MRVQPGQTFSYEHTFSMRDVDTFARLSGDRGRHHVEPDAQGRVIVHGLLVCSVPTRLGAEIDYVARDSQWLFIRPIYVGRPMSARVKIVTVDVEERWWRITMNIRIRDHEGRVAVRGESSGVILFDDEAALGPVPKG